ncbi:MAG: site-2 protease family protein [Clostridia bacterium]|nr:site-2 protease family protein [Clostridia bacterium]
MFYIIGIIKVIILIGFLIFIHEGGHCLVAKHFKITVREFAIGFGPKLISKKAKSGTTYTLRLVPLGGFCDMLGEDQRSDEEGSFSKASPAKRLAVLFAGPGVNIIFGIIVYFFVAFCGPKVMPVVDYISDEYKANLAGLESGDRVLEIDGHEIVVKTDIDKHVIRCEGRKLEMKIQKPDGKIETIIVTPTDIGGRYVLGVMSKEDENTLENCFKYGYHDTVNFLINIGDNVKQLLTGHVRAEQMMGPVGISNVVMGSEGAYEFFYLLALISISLGITNLLPIAILDGGKIVIVLIEMVRKKPLPEKVEEVYNEIGFLLIIGIAIAVCILDINRIV